MKKVIYSLIATAMMAAFCFYLFMGNVFRVSVPVVTVPGSYAEEFAEKNHLSHANVPDSIAESTELRYETFQYNIEDKYITLEKYDGEGEEIVIPYMIEGKLVKTIGEDFFTYSPNLKKVYISDVIEKINAKPTDSVELVVSSDYELKDKLTEDKWVVSTYNDSAEPIFSLGDLPFEYSKNSDGINLTLYTGDEDSILIPAYINGIPVTEVSFDLLGYELVVFPETVNAISGTTYANIYSKVFAIELAFTVISFILALLVFNLRIGRFKNPEEYVLSSPQIIIEALFFALQIGFAIWAINHKNLNWPVALLISTVIMGLNLGFIFMGEAGRKQVKIVQEKTSERISWMNELKLSVAHLADNIKDPDVKKAVNRVVEEIRYSDPTTSGLSIDAEVGMRRAVDDLISAVSRGDSDEILKQCDYTMKAVKERNEKCKAYKS